MENKTPEQWFKMLKEPYRSQAIANIDETYEGYSKYCHSLESAIDNSFEWSETKQGHTYWAKISLSLEQEKETYLENSQHNIFNFDLIRNWANERNLIEGTTPEKQLAKALEEIGELAKAILKNDVQGQKDGIGDLVVVLTNLATKLGFSIEDCLWHAWNEIKDRKGKMNNGTFEKE